MSPSAQSRIVFDLASLSEVKGRQEKPIRKVTLVLSVMMSILLIWTLSIALSPGNLSTSLEWLQLGVLVPGISCMLALMLFAAWKSGPGATSLSITSEGLQFTWRSGRVDSLGWNELGKGLALLDYTINPTLPHVSQNLWEVRRWKRPATYLSRNAFEAITRAACEHGLSVVSLTPKNNFWGWARCRIIRFNGVPRA